MSRYLGVAVSVGGRIFAHPADGSSAAEEADRLAKARGDYPYAHLYEGDDVYAAIAEMTEGTGDSPHTRSMKMDGYFGADQGDFLALFGDLSPKEAADLVQGRKPLSWWQDFTMRAALPNLGARRLFVPERVGHVAFRHVGGLLVLCPGSAECASYM